VYVARLDQQVWLFRHRCVSAAARKNDPVGHHRRGGHTPPGAPRRRPRGSSRRGSYRMGNIPTLGISPSSGGGGRQPNGAVRNQEATDL
jgi:hypothetical protein